MDQLSTVDLVAAAILGVAILRGLWLGLIREVTSLASLLAACLAVRRFTPEVAAWMRRAAEGGIDPRLAPWLAGAAIAVLALLAGALLGRLLRRAAKVGWLGMPDRIGGALLGAAEGALLCAILLLSLTSLVGRDHAWLAGARSIAALERLERIAGGAAPGAVDVAAPPPRRR